MYAAFSLQNQFGSFSNWCAIAWQTEVQYKLPDLAPSGLVHWQYSLAILTVVDQCSH